MQQWPTGFMLIQGNHLEDLRHLLVEWMRRYPLEPLENEVILVQSNGIAQWLKMALAADPSDDIDGGCGIAAALEVTLPARFIWRAYRAVLGNDLPEISPFDKAPLTWRLYRLLGRFGELAEQLDNPECLTPLEGFLVGENEPRLRHQLAGRLADLYDQYQVYRADWLTAWEQGQDVLIRANGTQVPLAEAQLWQPALWRLLKQDILAEAADGEGPFTRASRAEIHRNFLTRAHAMGPDERPRELPRRVTIFGVSSMARQWLEVLEAIAGFTQVMLCVHNPCQHYWGDIIEGRELFRQEYRRNPDRKVPAGTDPSQLHLYGHPLLAAWGKQGRDYIRLLDEHDQRERYEGQFQAQDLSIDLFDPPGEDSLLHQLQEDIFDLRSLPERQARATVIDPGRDHSLGFFIAHSPQREVEILHDQLIATFAASAGSATPLRPRDVLVMVPDINVYAPHVEAVFGRFDRKDPRYLPFHLSDQGQRHRNPVMIALEMLLDLPQARFSVTELLDLLDVEAVRTRFGVSESDLPQLREWIVGANVRWGLDGAQRASLDLPAGANANTWRFGLERMLLGFASGRAAPWCGVEPYDEIGGLTATLLGPLLHLLDTLEQAWRGMREPRTASQWVEFCVDLLDSFFTPASDTDELALMQVQNGLVQWEDDCRRACSQDEPLPHEVMRDALLGGLDQTSLTQRFLAGSINFATLMPMRAIPFRQIWLLGMNDGEYPRSVRPLDFDLMARDYRPGDRSRREDDRYLFLEALLSARERLMVSWVGRSILDNTECPPSVLVAQLRDHIAAGWRLPPGTAGTLLEKLTSEHPLQPFSRAYFDAGKSGLFTYASEWRHVHDAFADASGGDLGPLSRDEPLNLAQLGAFLKAPVDALFRQRLRIATPEEAGDPPEVETFELDGLSIWQLRDTILREVFVPGLSGDQLESELVGAVARAQARGQLPAGALGELLGEQVIAKLPELYGEWSQALARWPQTLDQSWTLEFAADTPEGTLQLEQTLFGVRAGEAGSMGVVQLQTSSLVKNKHYELRSAIPAWLRHLALHAAGLEVTTCILSPAGNVTLAPLEIAQARAELGELLASWGAAMQRPLPVAPFAAAAWLRAQGPQEITDEEGLRESKAWMAARRAMEEKDLVYDRGFLTHCYPDFESLWADGQFARWAHRLYGRLLRSLPANAKERT